MFMGVEMKNIVRSLCEKHNINPNLVLKKQIRGLNGITSSQLLEAILVAGTIKGAAEYLGYTLNPVKECVRSLLHPIFGVTNTEFGMGKTNKNNPALWRYSLLKSIDLKRCCSCEKIYTLDKFNKNTSSDDSLSYDCKACHTFSSKQAKASCAIRTPKWADLEAIKEIYLNCPEGYEVDHIIPLHGKYVSGLHISSNLQYLSKADNRRKSNKFIVHENEPL